MRYIMTFLLLSIFILENFAQQKNPDIGQFYPIETSHSYVEFSVKYMGYAKVKGRFAEFSGMFRYDPSELANTSVTLLIKTESLDTDLDFRDKDLKSENWLDAGKFPTIMFVSKKVLKKDPGFELTGDLTIRDVTKEVTLQMDPPSGILKDVRGDAQVIFTGRVTIDRTVYGVEGKRWSAVKEGITAVEKDVAIEFSILGKQLKASNFSNWVRDDQRPAGKLYKLVKEQGVNVCLAEFQKMKDGNAEVEGALIVASRMLMLEGNINDAITLMETNCRAFPNSANAAYMLGEIYGAKGDWTKAKDMFNQTVKLDATNVQSIELLRHL